MWIVVNAVLALMMAGDEPAGRTHFTEYGCNECHAVEVVKIVATETDEEKLGPDLSAVGSERDVEWLQKYMNKEVDVDGTKHKKRWRGTEDELNELATWLHGLAQ